MFISHTLVLASLLVPPSFSLDCPRPCTAAPNAVTVGTLPPGCTFFVTPGVPTNGTSDNEVCTTTCVPCLAQVAIQFHGTDVVVEEGQPQPPGVCMTLDVNGAGPSQPFVKYVRTGYMIANCDHQFCMYFNITTCHNPVTSLGYSALYCLYCGCG